MRQSIIGIYDLEKGDIVKAYKIKGMKKFETTYEPYFLDTDQKNDIKNSVVERGFMSGSNDWVIKLKINKEHFCFKFPSDTLVKCYRKYYTKYVYVRYVLFISSLILLLFLFNSVILVMDCKLTL